MCCWWSLRIPLLRIVLGICWTTAADLAVDLAADPRSVSVKPLRTRLFVACFPPPMLLLLLPALLGLACAGVWSWHSHPFPIFPRPSACVCTCTLSCARGLTVGHICLPNCHFCMHGAVLTAGGSGAREGGGCGGAPGFSRWFRGVQLVQVLASMLVLHAGLLVQVRCFILPLSHWRLQQERPVTHI